MSNRATPKMICNVFKRHIKGEKLIFTQTLPDSSTQVKIDTIPNSENQYYVEVHNDRTDTVFNSSPITEIFKDYLPKMVGTLLLPREKLPLILTDLMTATSYFGISVTVEDASYIRPREFLGYIFNNK